MTFDEAFEIGKIAEKHYSVKKMEHADMVRKYVQEDPRYMLMTPAEQAMVTAIAIAHDVIEDTKCSWNELQEPIKDEEDARHFYIAVDLLTRRHEDAYSEYIDPELRDIYLQI